MKTYMSRLRITPKVLSTRYVFSSSLQLNSGKNRRENKIENAENILTRTDVSNIQ